MTASVDVLPVVREYERTPGDDAERRRDAGRRDLRVAAGGAAERRADRRAAAADAVERRRRRRGDHPPGAGADGAVGPAAGVVGARDVAAACGIGDIITVDIGGTSADICLIKDGQIALTQRGHVGEWPLPLPMVDMVTIGAGGGSIAKVSDGALTVGPAERRRRCRARPATAAAARSRR